MSEILWVTEHLRDLEADFLVFYRIADLTQIPSAQFFALALRTPAYSGVMAARMAQERSKGTPQASGAHGLSRGPTTKITEQEHAQVSERVSIPSSKRSYLMDDEQVKVGG